MLTSIQNRLPPNFNPMGIGEPCVGVRILVSPDLTTPAILPGHNRTGTEILCRLLQARMELAGVKVTRVSRGLPLNRSAYIFVVSDLAAALEAIKGELETLRLLEYAQIAWRDAREEIWRMSHPRTGYFEAPSEEELAAESAFFAQIIETAQKFQPPKNESGSQ